MKKKSFFISLLLITGCVYAAEAQSLSSVKEVHVLNENNELTPLKPEDGVPFVFTTEEDRASCIEKKKDNILAEIKKNSGDSLKVRLLREELWRLENSIVKGN